MQLKNQTHPQSANVLYFTGIGWKEKIAALRAKMVERKVLWFVVTALDEVACKYPGWVGCQISLSVQ